MIKSVLRVNAPFCLSVVAKPQNQNFDVLASLPLTRERILLCTHLLEWKAATQAVVPLDSAALSTLGLSPPAIETDARTLQADSCSAVRCSMAAHTFLSSHGLHAEAAKVAWVLGLRLYSALRLVCCADGSLSSDQLLSPDLRDTLEVDALRPQSLTILTRALAAAVGAAHDSLELVSSDESADAVIVVAHPPSAVSAVFSAGKSAMPVEVLPQGLSALVPSVTSLPQVALAAAVTEALVTLVEKFDQAASIAQTSSGLEALLSEVLLMPEYNVVEMSTDDQGCTPAVNLFGNVPLLSEMRFERLCDSLLDSSFFSQALTICHLVEAASDSRASLCVDLWISRVFQRLGRALGSAQCEHPSSVICDGDVLADAQASDLLRVWVAAYRSGGLDSYTTISEALRAMLDADATAAPRRSSRVTIAAADGVSVIRV